MRLRGSSAGVATLGMALMLASIAGAQEPPPATAPPGAEPTTPAAAPAAEPTAASTSSEPSPAAPAPEPAATEPPPAELAAPEPPSTTETEPNEQAEKKASEKDAPALGSQKDDRGPIGKGFGERWIAMPTISSNPKLSTSFGATGIVFVRFDDSVASTIAMGGAYSVSNSWTAFAFAKLNFLHDRERFLGGMFRGHAANSYDNFMDEGIALESTSNVLAVPTMWFHRLGERTKTDWWVGGALMYVKLDQAGEDPTSSEIIEDLDLEGTDGMAFGPVLLFDSRDNQNSPTKGQRLFVRPNLWHELASDTDFFGAISGSYSYYYPFKYLVLAMNASVRFSFGAPLALQSSLSRFRAYTVGEQIAENTMSIQAEARIPFGKTRFGASAFGGVATLFDDFADWDEASVYHPMIGAGLRFLLSPKQGSIMRLEYAQGVDDARGIYLAMGQPFN